MSVFNEEKIYWIGSRESDINYTGNLFAGSIALYGETENCIGYNKISGKRIDNNTVSDKYFQFIDNSIEKIIEKDSKARFCFYDSSWAYLLKNYNKHSERFLCVNKKEVLDKLNDKISFHSFAKSIVPKLRAKIVKGKTCNYDELCSLFKKEKTEFVVQCAKSNGGEGTFILNKRNSNRLNKMFDAESKYIVTEYCRSNISLNMHLIIDDNDVTAFPGSVQLIRYENDRLIFRGSDYETYKRLDNKYTSLFLEYCKKLGKEIWQLGYRGICGIDGLIYGDNVYILEFNGRFQGSSMQINKALESNGLPCLQAMNISAFEGKKTENKAKIENLSGICSSYFFHKAKTDLFGNNILANYQSEKAISEINTDGYSKDVKLKKNIYMFRVLVEGSISSVNPNGGINLNEGLVEPDINIYKKVIGGDLLAIKITLMSLGAKFTENAKNWLISNGGMRPGNNNAVDLNMLGMIINAPLDIKFIAFTPYTIDLIDEHLVLFYYGNKICNVEIYPLDPLSTKHTSRGVPYTTVAFLSTDRLRVHMTNECVFKNQCKSCRFCNITPCEDPIDIKDIQEVVKDYIYNSPNATHFLVGGQSMGQEAGKKRIIEMVQAIRKYEKDKHIYVMALPYDKPTIKSLVEAGMNELSCNIEIFDDKLALEYMPGKGAIPRETYYDVLSYAKELLPEKGAVRSMLILGLEPDKSFIQGVKRLVSIGVQPIVSIYRPLPDTPLEYLVAPPLMYVYRMYHKLEKICLKENLRLGPECVHCQNNTLSLPYTD